MQTTGQSLTFLALFLPFIAAAAAPFLTRYLKHNAAWVLALAPAWIFFHFTGFLETVGKNGAVTAGYDWIPSLGVRFSWFLDGLSLTFALLISGIGTLIVLYAGGYLKGHEHQGRFFSFILMFMGAMQGLVVSDSFLMLFVFWELTSITSFLLIGFDHGREASRRAALQALVVTGLGGLSLLAGLLVTWMATGQSELSALVTSGSVLRDSPFYLAALVLVFGGATLLTGTLLAVRQTDLKLMLAYTTVASLGLLVMLTGFGSEKGGEAAVLYLIAHSMFKGALFMVAGTIDHEAGTRDVRRLGGLRAAMPVTFAAALVAAISMGGLPPLFGFLAKEEIYAALGFSDGWTIFLLVVAIIGNALMFAVGFAVALKPFLGPHRDTPKHAHEGPVLLWLGPVILGLAGIVAALFSKWSHGLFSSPMATAVAGTPVEVHISVVPHLSVPLALSAVTIVLGVLVYLTIDRLRDAIAATLTTIGWGPDKGFDQAMRGLIRGSRGVTQVIQSGKLDIYMTITFVLVAASMLVPMVVFDELPAVPDVPDMHFYEWSIIAIAVIGLGAVIYAKDRLTAIVSLGIQGFAVALLFMIFGAPDLSFTQFMVETLSVVILALVMTRLKLTPADHRPTVEKLVDISVAAACGAGFGLTLLKVTQGPFDATLTEFFNAYSYTIAHGRNVVNVILVDFRGLDTLGEIAVVMVAGLSILALVRIRTRKPRADEVAAKGAA